MNIQKKVANATRAASDTANLEIQFLKPQSVQANSDHQYSNLRASKLIETISIKDDWSARLFLSEKVHNIDVIWLAVYNTWDKGSPLSCITKIVLRKGNLMRLEY